MLSFVPNPMASTASLMNLAKMAGGVGNLMGSALNPQVPTTVPPMSGGMAAPTPAQPAPLPAYQAPTPPPMPTLPPTQPFNPQAGQAAGQPQPIQALNPMAQNAVNGPMLAAMLGSQNWGGQMPINPLIDPQTSLAMSQGARQGAYAPVDAYNSMANLQMDNAKVQQQAQQHQENLQEAQRRQRFQEWQQNVPESERMLMESAERFKAAKYANDLAISRDDRNYQQQVARDQAQFENQWNMHKQTLVANALMKGIGGSGRGAADPSLLKSSEFTALYNAVDKDPNVMAANLKYQEHLTKYKDPVDWFNKWAESYSFVLPTVRTKAGPGSPEGGNWKGDVGKASSPDTMLSDAEARQFIKENPIAARRYAGHTGRPLITVKDAFQMHTEFLGQSYQNSVDNTMAKAYARRIGAIPLDVSEDIDSELARLKPPVGAVVVHDMQPYTVLGIGKDGKFKWEPVSQTRARANAEQQMRMFQALTQALGTPVQ